MKFDYVTIYVQNPVKTLEFYEAAFGLKRKFVSPEEDYAELDTGETKLCFADEKLRTLNKIKTLDNRKDALPPACEISFIVEDLPKAYDKAIENGAELLVPIEEKPWGQSVAYLKDINGFLIALGNPVQSPNTDS